MSFLSGLLKNIKLGDDDEQKPKIKKIDTDHNWWDAVKNTAGDFATGGIGGVIGGEINRRNVPIPLPPLLGDLPDAKIAGVDALTPKPLLPPVVPPSEPNAAPSYDVAKFRASLPPLTPDTVERPSMQFGTGNGAGLPSLNTAQPEPPPAPPFSQLFRDKMPSLNPDSLERQQPPPMGSPDGVELPSLSEATRFEVPPPPNFSELFKDKLPSLAPQLDSQRTANDIARIEGKKYGFKKDADGKVLRDDKGKPVYEKDRDSDHNWWDVVKSAGLGFAKGGLSGAIGGAVGGAIDRNYDEKAIDDIKLNRLNQKFEGQMNREQAQQGYQMRETQRKNIDADNARADDALALRKATSERNSLLGQVRKMERYKRGENPEFDAKLEAAHIEQPDFEKGKKILPRFWDGNGNYKIFNEKGGVESVLDEKGQPITDETKATIYVDGYAVKGRDALTAKTAAGVTNTRFGNEDDQDRIKYENDVQEVKTFNQGVDAEIQSKRQIAQNLELANQTLQAQRDQLATNPILNSEQIKQLDQQINSNTNEWRKANAEVTALGGKKKPLPVAPKPRRQVSSPTVNNVGSYSEPQFRKNFEGKYSPAEIDKLVATAKQQGIIK